MSNETLGVQPIRELPQEVGVLHDANRVPYPMWTLFNSIPDTELRPVVNQVAQHVGHSEVIGGTSKTYLNGHGEVNPGQLPTNRAIIELVMDGEDEGLSRAMAIAKEADEIRKQLGIPLIQPGAKRSEIQEATGQRPVLQLVKPQTESNHVAGDQTTVARLPEKDQARRRAEAAKRLGHRIGLGLRKIGWGIFLPGVPKPPELRKPGEQQ